MNKSEIPFDGTKDGYYVKSDKEVYVRCNWCGKCTDRWSWQQKQKDGSIVAKCQMCVDQGKTIPVIPFKKENQKPETVEYGG